MSYNKTTIISEQNVLDLISILNNHFNTDKFKIIGSEFNVGNPFSTSVNIYISETNTVYNGDTLLEISYESNLNGYCIRIGQEYGTSWSGGLEYSKCWFGGYSKGLDFNSLLECFEKYNNMYSLQKIFGCGYDFVKNIKINDLVVYAKENNFNLFSIKDFKRNEFDFNYFEPNMSFLINEDQTIKIFVYNPYDDETLIKK